MNLTTSTSTLHSFPCTTTVMTTIDVISVVLSPAFVMGGSTSSSVLIRCVSPLASCCARPIQICPQHSAEEQRRPLQRVPLLAYNAPLLRTSTSSIDFGFCLHDSLHAGHASEAAVAVYGADDSDGADGTKTVSSLRCQIVRPLFVTNIGAIRSNCMLQMPSTTALQGAYSASPSFAVLEPGQVQRFDISFTPQSNKHYGKCPPFPFRLYSLHLPLS